MLELKLRKNIWYIVGYVGDKRIRESTKIKKPLRSLAEAMLKEKQLADGITTVLPTFRDAANNYLNRSEGVNVSDQVLVQRQLRYWEDTPLEDITSLDINNYGEVTHKNNKSDTRKRDLNILKAILNRATLLGLLMKTPKVIMPKGESSRDRNLLPDEKKAYVNELRDDEIGVLNFILYTGCRLSECLTLRVKDLNLKDNEVTLASYKSRHGNINKRTVNIPLKLRLILDSIHISTKPSDYVFVHRDVSAGKYVGRKFSCRWVRARHNKICQKLGIEDYRVHDHRHTYGTELIRLGVPETKIADLMGHSDLKMVRRYTKLSQKEYGDYVNKLS
jgi:integrase|tara:strand:+ start:1031 stop:2029 length:999 start_codon:yes stop_codon:yes gene_type:complete